MRNRVDPTHRILAAVDPGALRSFGGRTSHRSVTGHVAAPATEFGLFVGGSTFVGHGVIEQGTARLTLRQGLAGFVTLFVSVADEVRGVAEVLVGDDGSLVVAGRDGFQDILRYLEAFGAIASDVEATPTLDPDAAQRWMTNLAVRGFVEPPRAARTAMAAGND